MDNDIKMIGDMIAKAQEERDAPVDVTNEEMLELEQNYPRGIPKEYAKIGAEDFWF